MIKSPLPFAPLASFACAALFALGACGSNTPDDASSSEAEDFAARINGSKSAPPAPPQASASIAPTVAESQPDVTPGPFEPGTATDPNTACNANRFGEFLGQKPSTEVRSAIMEAASGGGEVRFVAPGSDYIMPDPTHPRLNVMIAVDGVIRDIRCG